MDRFAQVFPFEGDPENADLYDYFSLETPEGTVVIRAGVRHLEEFKEWP